MGCYVLLHSCLFCCRQSRFEGAPMRARSRCHATSELTFTRICVRGPVLCARGRRGILFSLRIFQLRGYPGAVTPANRSACGRPHCGRSSRVRSTVLDDKKRSGAPKEFEDKEFEKLLNEDPSQTLAELGKSLQVDQSTISKRLKSLGMIIKQGHRIAYEWKPRASDGFFFTYELLLQWQKRKSFLHRIRERSRLQLMRLIRASKVTRPLYEERHERAILLRDNVRPHVAKPVKTYLETIIWEGPSHALYSPDKVSADYQFFRSIAYGLAELRFHSYKDTKKKKGRFLDSLKRRILFSTWCSRADRKIRESGLQ
ncbi:Mariner Mos1 transposase [Eumeta japonica]|uniref:Mariner Mos1 transposase n=1 Tax=Eumeta variegata TaxID=151549 RepID=A0A4C1XA93_EUMVA|nr:Mariner Mos1 transposase [Eumeta japonica]